MSRAFYDGFIFQNEGNGKSLAVTQIGTNKYWGIEIFYDGKNGSSYYADIGIIRFPDNIGDIVASFNIKNTTLRELLEARHDIKRVLGELRQYASKRREQREGSGYMAPKEAATQMFSDKNLSEVEQARVTFDYLCDRLFWEYLTNRV